jgi:hypothetical protein
MHLPAMVAFINGLLPLAGAGVAVLASCPGLCYCFDWGALGCMMVLNVRLILGPTTLFRRGTECCQCCCMVPAITKTSPAARFKTILCSRCSFCRKTKSRAAPRDTEAMVGAAPYNGSSSAGTAGVTTQSHASECATQESQPLLPAIHIRLRYITQLSSARLSSAQLSSAQLSSSSQAAVMQPAEQEANSWLLLMRASIHGEGSWDVPCMCRPVHLLPPPPGCIPRGLKGYLNAS